jgi:hypothetical protein
MGRGPREGANSSGTAEKKHDYAMSFRI